MADKPGPGRADWRNRNAAGQSPSAGNRNWRDDKKAASGTSWRSYRGTVLAVLAVLLVLAAAAFVKVVFFPELAKPLCFALLGAGYEENLALPHNAYGMMGLKDLSAASAGTHLVNVRHFQKSLISRQVWDEEWGKIHKESKEDTLVLFLALHGMADDSDAYLLFDDPAGSAKLPLTELLNSLAELDRKVLLILEPALAGAYWPAGIVHNDFVAKLKDPKTGIDKRKNLVVLCASDEGQTSWASEERGRTIFTEFLLEGLKGEAGGDRPNRVALADLYKYVKEKVENWSWHNRAAVQTPILLGGEEQIKSLDLVTLQAPAKVADAPGDQEDGGKPAAAANKNLTASGPLMSLWNETAELRKAVPSPAVYTPQLWRYYLDLGVRFEQLERAGYPAADLKRLRGVLEGIAMRIRNEARCNEAAACIGWTLPMQAVLGIRAPLDDKQVEAGLEALQLADNGKKRNDAFAALAKKVPSGFPGSAAEARKLVRGQVHRALLNKIAMAIDPNNLDPTWQDVRTLADFLDNGEDRPAETHLLVMLLQDLDRKSPPSAELLRKALAVRRQAEEAALGGAPELRTHPYGEAVFGRVRVDIDDADGLRRTGEDWLFASGAKDHERANADLTKAAALYKQAGNRASTVRAALDIRDRALADLPYFAWWIAIQRDPKQGQHLREKELSTWEDATKTLAENLKDIAADLGDPKKFDHLPEATSKAQIAYKALGDALRTELRSLETAPEEQEHWQQTEAALALPILVAAQDFDAAKNREKLLNNSRRMSRLWNAEQIRPRDGVAGNDAGKKSGRQEAMLAAALKPYDVLPDRPQFTVRDVRAAMEPSADEDKLLAGALSNPDPVAARKALNRVDFAWRRLPVTQRMVDRADTASRVLRSLRLIDLLVWQADRTARDHWFAEEKSTDHPGFLGTTYYQPAARAYLDAATQLAKQRIDDRKQKETLAKVVAGKLAALDKATFLHRKQGPNLLWTGVQDHLLQWKIAKDEGAALEPFGVPVAWLGQPKGAKISNAQTSHGAFAPYGRLTLDALGPPINHKEETLDFKLARDKEFETAPKVKGEFVVLYRGAKLRESVPIESREPDLIVRNEQPLRDPEVAVQATGSNAAVCILLDCSLSMKNPSTTSSGETRTRFQWATEALNKALANFPQGTLLSVRAMIYPRNLEIRAPRPWELGQRDRLIEELADLEKKIPAEGASPIADALVDAKEKGFRGWTGLKVIVALTDGDDNYSGVVRKHPMPAYDERNPEPFYNANTKFVKNLMQEHFNNNVKEDYEVHIVCFIDPNKKEDQEEARRADEQFRIVREFEPLPGTFRREPDGRRLADGLAEAIRPKLYLKRGATSKTIPATYTDTDEGFQWKEVKAGTYTPGLRERQQGLEVARGDKLLVRIIDGGLRRAMVTDQLETRKASRGKVVGVALHQWDKNNQLNQRIAIEDDDTKLLQHERPGFVWIDTAPVGKVRPRRITWQPEYHHSAPYYRIEALNWPPMPGNPIAPTPALTRVWWGDAPAGAMQARVQLTPGEVKEVKEVRFGDSEVSIDEVEINHLPAKAGEKPSRCLVVKLSYQAEKRFRLELAPPPLVEEHRYFTDAGHYTAIFWTDIETVPYTLRIIAVSAICDKLAPVRFDLDRKIDQRLLGD